VDDNITPERLRAAPSWDAADADDEDPDDPEDHDHCGPDEPKLDPFSPLFTATPHNIEALRYQMGLLGEHQVPYRWSLWPDDTDVGISARDALEDDVRRGLERGRRALAQGERRVRRRRAMSNR
jgi:hypothetical protein